MNNNLGDNQKSLLRKAVVDKKQALVTFSMAKKIYGSSNQAKKGLAGLENKGIIEEIDGSHRMKFEITNLPEDLYAKWIK
jgi:predicted transcriptional regulator